MKKIVDILSAIFVIIPFVCIASVLIGKKIDTPLFGFLPWQIELVVLDIFPFVFAIFWFASRYTQQMTRFLKLIRPYFFFILFVLGLVILVKRLGG